MTGSGTGGGSGSDGGKRGNTGTPFEWESKHHGHLESRTPLMAEKNKQSIVISRKRRYLADPDADPMEPYITGRYEDVDGKWTFHVNQAGKHIEVWMSEVISAEMRRPKQMIRLAGDRFDDSMFSLYLEGKPEKLIGTVRRFWDFGTKHLEVYLSGNDIELKFVAVQNNGYPVLSESGMAVVDPPLPVVRLNEWSPLVKSEVKWLRKKLGPEELDPYIKEFFSLSAAADMRATLRRHEIVMELDEYMGEVFSTKPPDGWHPDDIPLVQFTARGILAQKHATFNDATRSYYDWIQAMLLFSSGELAWDKLPVLMQNHLLMSVSSNASKSGQLYEYEADFKIGGFAGEVIVSLGGWVGALTVEKKTPPTWKQMYDIGFFQIGAGVGVGIQVGQQNDGTAKSPFAYTPGDIPGACTLMSSGVHGGVVVGGSPGFGMLSIHGSNLPPLAFNLSSLWSWNVELGAGADVLTFMPGWIRKPSIKGRPKILPTKILKDEDFTVAGGHSNEIHFRLGDAMLTDDARQLLRIICSRELKSFKDPFSIMGIVGHADRVDTEDRNIELSRLRSKNTLQAIRDILGSDFLIKPENITISAMGEERAKTAGDLDGYPNLKWRKVEVIVNHRLVLNLRGE